MKRRRTDAVEAKLVELEDVAGLADAVEIGQRVKAALGHRHYRVVAKAADLCAEKLLYDLTPALVDAYQRFLHDPVDTDKTCRAKRAIVRALYELDYDDTLFYCDAIRYRQPEPVWGGSVDTAVELRCTSALGLAATGYPRAAIELIELLNDPEFQARVGAVRAIATLNPFQAEIVLRGKVLQGDAEPEVIGECFAALLSIEPQESVTFVGRYLEDSSPDLREMAALALGDSRLDEALELLRSCWEEGTHAPGFRRVLLRAIALLRRNEAYDFLLTRIETDNAETAAAAAEVLAIYRHNDQLRARVQEAVGGRDEPAIAQAFEQAWRQ